MKCFRTVSIFILSSVLLDGCGQQVEPQPVTWEETGSIGPENPTDPNHMNFPFASFTFQAEKFDRVEVELISADFDVLLKLVEVETGAPLAEWDAQYPDGKAFLAYTIAGPGEYEVRVYSMSVWGEYKVRITLSQ